MSVTGNRLQPTLSEAQRPAIVELLGPPGCGKSTVTEALLARSPILLAGERLAFSNIRRMPGLLMHTTALAPLSYRQIHRQRRVSGQDLKDMLYVHTWHRVLRRQARRSASIVLVDQGPVFKLAWLQGFGPGTSAEPVFQRWWHRACARWSGVLRLVVHLDASDEVLLERVRARRKSHPLQQMDEHAARAYLDTYRHSLRGVIDRLGQSATLVEVRIATDRMTSEEVADSLLPLLLGRPSEARGERLPGLESPPQRQTDCTLIR